MRRLQLMSLLCIAITLFAFGRDETKYVHIEEPFANIYEQLDPQSPIIRQAQKNEYYPLVYEGTSWYQVRVPQKGKIGWLERDAGIVVDSMPLLLFGFMPLRLFALFVVLVFVTIIGSILFIFYQKRNEL